MYNVDLLKNIDVKVIFVFKQMQCYPMVINLV